MLEKIKNKLFDTDYTKYVEFGWYPEYDKNILKKSSTNKKNVWFFDKIFSIFFPSVSKKDNSKASKKNKIKTTKTDDKISGKSLEEQLKYIINLPDDKYDDKLLTPELRKYILEYEKEYVNTLADYKDHIAPSYFEVKPSYFNVSWMFGRTYYANMYPSYIDFLWTRDVISFDGKWDMSWFIYPEDDAKIQAMLKRRATQLKAEINSALERGITLDMEIQKEYEDVEEIRRKLTTREERYFEASYYISLYENDLEKLDELSKKFEQKISWYGVRVKRAAFRMDEGFNSTLPLCIDDLWISRSMVTTSLAGSFPFISNELSDSEWILYGINKHTWGLVIFNRFSKKLPNANEVILATSWAGKSFTTKLEILRYLLLWVEVIVIDPENEYKTLIDKVWWTYINVAVNSQQHINPFDLPPKIEDVEYGQWDLLRSHIMNLIWLIGVLIWGLTPEEESILDKALQTTYSLKEITFEDESMEWKTPPLMEDLLNVLEWMEWWDKIATRLYKYVKWTYWKLFNNYTNVDLDSWLTVFSIRDLEDALKTPAMYNILNFIWWRVRAKKRPRILVIDEAWIMMKHNISANFLYGLIKRARKYKLWVTTITQDIEDFIRSEYGKPIISNSSIQILLKQSPASIKSLQQILWLSDAEKQLLVASWVWEGLFFAGNQHIAIKILASPYEKEFIQT